MLEAAVAPSILKTLTLSLYHVAKCIVKLANYELKAIVDKSASRSTFKNIVARRLGLFNFLKSAHYNFLTSSGEQHTSMGLLR